MMAFSFFADSPLFWFCSIVYWLIACAGWVELAADGSLNWNVFRNTVAIMALMYASAVAVIALLLTLAV